jgi:hypothetical protein
VADRASRRLIATAKIANIATAGLAIAMREEGGSRMMTSGKTICVLTAAAAIALAVTGGAQSAATKVGGTPGSVKRAENSPLVLAHGGLILRGATGQAARTLSFGTPRATAIALVTSQLGPAIKTGVYPECGDGKPLGYADFRGGLQLTFSNTKFVGWTLDAKGDVRNRMANGVGIGTTVATLQKLVPDVFIDPGEQENGGLGPGFQSDTWPSGWLDGARPSSKIVSMYAGKTCIVA